MSVARSRVPSGSAGTVEHFVAVVRNRLDGSPLAVMLDIDGTLAPIVRDPAAARLPDETRQMLRGLIRLPDARVALVSGRSAADAWRIAGEDGAFVIGNHGMELRMPDGSIHVDDLVREHEATMAEAWRRLATIESQIPGSIVENKRWTLSLHYRMADPSAGPEIMSQAIKAADSLGLRVREGKMIVEVRPPVRVDKGTACVAFAERVGALRGNASAMYAGDDDTDEDAFRELRARSDRAVTVRIIEHGDASAPTGAEFVLHSPAEMRDVLGWLLSRRENGAGR